ncbi:MAG: hypothetical protein E5X23_15535 [Mesorhizobium sp.]|uniref:hypothetical protein n=1 Tax=unclassified Mesorhizobium TaxID=325217 RepID=UPI000F756A62|nr:MULTISPECIES: hypothetical protein [unclassified Mesorhizobium]TGV92225.1 hypothetical protein EN801_015125 [Mesorhizobium sp. M00.F.Ca.ET.158.01.1.1]AZO58349.1 hypothetical protein EJ078_02730 [Mesorhizobium sp. M1A.F.Ca.IN.022.06.1.1]MCT2579562.1 hypothetical protein [Mesorhizobium sp. P13.3]MDF3168263.1 hypothetical protein [Mesorhizobium sp. P16.1]MDF3177863.1 hypothetical protein [Mesorhizobium sp. P17.1]
MPRYATIITGDDSAEIVSAIGEFASFGEPPRTSRVEAVAPGVRIGMVRGGPVDAIAGFGFPRQGLDPSAMRAAAAKLKRTEPFSGQVDQPSAPKAARAKPRKKPARKPAKWRAVRSAGTPAADAAVNG